MSAKEKISFLHAYSHFKSISFSSNSLYHLLAFSNCNWISFLRSRFRSAVATSKCSMPRGSFFVTAKGLRDPYITSAVWIRGTSRRYRWSRSFGWRMRKFFKEGWSEGWIFVDRFQIVLNWFFHIVYDFLSWNDEKPKIAKTNKTGWQNNVPCRESLFFDHPVRFEKKKISFTKGWKSDRWFELW